MSRLRLPYRATGLIDVAAKNYIESKKNLLDLREKSSNPNARKFDGYLRILERFVDFIGPETPVKKISGDDLVRWMSAEKGRNISLASISRGINTIRACLNHAKDDPKNEDLINYRVPKRPIKKSASDNKRIRILTADEIKTLSEALNEISEYQDAYHYLLFCLGSGARMDEALGLIWERIDWERKSITLYSSKTNKFRTLILP